MTLSKTQQGHADAFRERFMVGLKRKNPGQPEFHQRASPLVAHSSEPRRPDEGDYINYVKVADAMLAYGVL